MINQTQHVLEKMISGVLKICNHSNSGQASALRGPEISCHPILVNEENSRIAEHFISRQRIVSSQYAIDLVENVSAARVFADDDGRTNDTTFRRTGRGGYVDP